MDNMDMQEMDSEDTVESPAPTSEEGYEILIHVSENGYTVDNGEELHDATDMLKAILAIIKSNPIAETASDELEAGFHA